MTLKSRIGLSYIVATYSGMALLLIGVIVARTGVLDVLLSALAFVLAPIVVAVSPVIMLAFPKYRSQLAVPELWLVAIVILVIWGICFGLFPRHLRHAA